MAYCMVLPTVHHKRFIMSSIKTPYGSRSETKNWSPNVWQKIQPERFAFVRIPYDISYAKRKICFFRALEVLP